MVAGQSRVEQFVVDAALGCGLLTHEQVEDARFKQRSSTGEGGLLSLLARQMDEETNRHLSAIYREVVAAEAASRLPSGGDPVRPASRETPTPRAPHDSDSQLLMNAVTYRSPESERRASAFVPTRTPEALALSKAETVPGGGRPAERSAGERIGPYEVRRELGRGGMGLVYEAIDTRSGEVVALKVLLRGGGARVEDVKRFQIEARAAQRLSHPNLVGVLDHGQDEEGTWYTALEFVEGHDLSERLKQGPIDPDEAVRIVRDLALGLACAHEHNVLHRDLKPHNVLIQPDGTPRLTDFGLAKLHDDLDASLTHSGAILGTPAYMSPEQADGNRHELSERTDVYGLGATLYHMLTGTPPFVQASMTAILLQILSKPPARPSLAVPEIDSDLDAIVLKCLAKAPDDRYPSARALARDLNRWLKSLDVLAEGPSPLAGVKVWLSARPERVAIVSVIAGALIVATLAVAWGSFHASPQAAAAADELGSLPALSVTPKRPEGRAPAANVGRGDEAVEPPRPTPQPEQVDPEPRGGTSPSTTERSEPGAQEPSEAAPSSGRPGGQEPSHRRLGPSPHRAGVQPGDDRGPLPAPPQPGRKREPTPPSSTPSEASGRAGTAVSERRAPPSAAKAPPEWLRWRGERLATKGRQLIFTPSWTLAKAEAQARGVPILVVLLPATTRRLPSKLTRSKTRRLINEEAVTLFCMAPHATKTRSSSRSGSRRPARGGSGPPPRGSGPPHRGGGPPPRGSGPPGPPPRGAGPPPRGGQGSFGGPPGAGSKPGDGLKHDEWDSKARCKVLSGRRCGIHLDTYQPIASDSRFPLGSGPRVFVCDAAGIPQRTLEESELGRLGAEIKARSRGELGGAAMRLAATVFRGSRATTSRSKSDDSKACRGLSECLEAAAPVSNWARFALQTYCESEIRAAKGDSRRLELLAERTRADPRCEALVKQAR